MLKNHLVLIAIICAVIVGGGVLFYVKVKYLTIAHSTFENYAQFRGCTNIASKTDAKGTCTTSSGEKVKIVKFNGQWYLDGDLPVCGLHIGSRCLFNWP